MAVPIKELVKRWGRGTIDHSKVLIVYDSSDTGSDSQQDIANAYRDAWGLALPLYAVDLSSSTSRNSVSMWSAWLSGLADYVIANNVEAICAPTTFGDSTGSLTPDQTGDQVSAVNLLGGVKAIKEVMDANSATELSDIQTQLKSLIANAWTDLQFDASGNLLEDQMATAGEHFKGQYLVSTADQATRYSGMADIGAPGNPDVISVGEVEYSGVGFDTYIDKTTVSLTHQQQNLSQSVYPADNHAAVRATPYLPCWRIGFFVDASSTSFTVSDCQAMVARSKAARQPIAYHKNKTVLTGVNDRGAETIIAAPNFCALDAMATDLGFNTKLGYLHAGTNIAELDKVGTNTGIAKYSTAEADYMRRDGQAIGSGDTYRGYPAYDASGNLVDDSIRYFTQNGNTFPIQNVLLSYENTKYNNSFFLNDEVYKSGPNQLISLATGAIGTDSTSNSKGLMAAFIMNGGSAFYGSLREPTAEEDVNNGTVFMTKLLRGATAGEAALGLNGESISFHELAGDGLAQPFYLQSTVNDMIVHKAKEPICYSKANTADRGRGKTNIATESVMGGDYRVEIPDSAGVTQAVIVGYSEFRSTMNTTSIFYVTFSVDDSPAIDGTTPSWPEWLVATFECIVGTLTFDSTTSWTKTTSVDGEGRTYATFEVDTTGQDYFAQQLDPATTGVEAHLATVAVTHDAADTSITYTISGTPTDFGFDFKAVYNDTAKQGPFFLVRTGLNFIQTEFPTVVFGYNVGTTFDTAINDSLVITDPVTVTFSNTSIASAGRSSLMDGSSDSDLSIGLIESNLQGYGGNRVTGISRVNKTGKHR